MGFSPALQFTQSLPSCPTSSLLLSCVLRAGRAMLSVGDTTNLFYAPLREGVMCFVFSKVLSPLSFWGDPLCTVCTVPHIAWVQDLPCWRSLLMSHLSCLTL